MLLGSLGWLLLSSRRALSKDLTERKPDALLVGLVHRRPAPEHHHAHAPLGLVQRLGPVLISCVDSQKKGRLALTGDIVVVEWSLIQAT